VLVGYARYNQEKEKYNMTKEQGLATLHPQLLDLTTLDRDIDTYLQEDNIPTDMGMTTFTVLERKLGWEEIKEITKIWGDSVKSSVVYETVSYVKAQCLVYDAQHLIQMLGKDNNTMIFFQDLVPGDTSIHYSLIYCKKGFLPTKKILKAWTSPFFHTW